MSNRRIFYRISKHILGPIFNFYYNPKVEGVENIPLEGSAVIAGNHIHLYDQCTTINVSKRIITYLAKKEYFDNKKTAWFFRSVGCIPVDRKNKDANATNSALEVLNSGEMIGIFPEGTRNAFKEEKMIEYHDKYFKEDNLKKFIKKIKKSNIKYSQILYLEELLNNNKIEESDFINNFFEVDNYLKKLLDKKNISKKEYYKSCFLPLKFGAVSMAYKTNSVIVPVCVVGDYKFRSKNLIVRYGKPFKVTSDDLEYFNNKLLDELIKLMSK